MPHQLRGGHIESGDYASAHKDLKRYLDKLSASGVDTLVLGCTHYPAIKNEARKIMGDGVEVVSQDEIIPNKLKDYLKRHPEIETKLSKNSRMEFLVTKKTMANQKFASKLFNSEIYLKKVMI